LQPLTEGKERLKDLSDLLAKIEEWLICVSYFLLITRIAPEKFQYNLSRLKKM